MSHVMCLAFAPPVLACPISLGESLAAVTQAGTDVWVGGYYLNSGVLTPRQARYSSSAWSVHNSAPANAYCTALTATATNNVLAGQEDNSGAALGLIYRWTGAAWALDDTWTVTGGDPAGSYFVHPSALVAVSSSDIYATGSQITAPTPGSAQYLRHYNGSAWSWYTLPAALSGLVNPRALAASGASDVWVAGSDRSLVVSGTGYAGEYAGRVTGSSTGSTYQTVHYGQLYGLTAVDSTHVYAVGYRVSSAGAGDDTRSAVWYNGTTWADWGTLPALPAGAGQSYLYGVAGTSTSDLWAVGWYYTDVGQTASAALIYHWTGSAWVDASPPLYSGPGQYVSLYGVTAISTTDIWAVGDVYCGGSDHLLTLHGDGSTWSDIPIT